jgi:hypothetical protein
MRLKSARRLSPIQHCPCRPSRGAGPIPDTKARMSAEVKRGYGTPIVSCIRQPTAALHPTPHSDAPRRRCSAAAALTCNLQTAARIRYPQCSRLSAEQLPVLACPRRTPTPTVFGPCPPQPSSRPSALAPPTTAVLVLHPWAMVH